MVKDMFMGTDRFKEMVRFMFRFRIMVMVVVRGMGTDMVREEQWLVIILKIKETKTTLKTGKKWSNQCVRIISIPTAITRKKVKLKKER